MWASPFDFHRSWNSNLGSSGELMVFSTLKMLEQTNDAFGSISFNRLESNEEKYSLSVTGKRFRI
jgi:hypothetical protein